MGCQKHHPQHAQGGFEPLKKIGKVVAKTADGGDEGESADE